MSRTPAGSSGGKRVQKYCYFLICTNLCALFYVFLAKVPKVAYFCTASRFDTPPYDMQLQTIAHARNAFADKFGIPRQSRDDSCIETRIVFTPAYRVREALRGIEGYSHLWLLWGFDRVAAATPAGTWHPTVRPPRLGGNTRMGVFATRSPFRPNPIGLTCVRLLRVEDLPHEGTTLVVAGADLLDGTPVYDIKPYLSFTDSRPNACNGFADAAKDYRLAVQIDPVLLRQALRNGCPWDAICEILAQDPRPAYQHDPLRTYSILYAGWKVAFRVESATVCVGKLTRD